MGKWQICCIYSHLKRLRIGSSSFSIYSEFANYISRRWVDGLICGSCSLPAVRVCLRAMNGFSNHLHSKLIGVRFECITDYIHIGVCGISVHYYVHTKISIGEQRQYHSFIHCMRGFYGALAHAR